MQAPLTQSLGILIVTSTVLAMLAQRIKMPGLVVYMFTGLLLGPVLGLISANEVLNLISESGIALLLFLVGLEISVGRVKDIGKVAVVAGVGQVVFTGILGFILASALQYEVMESIYLATGLTFSSTVVVVKLLDQKGHLDSLYGRIAVGIFLVQDIIVILILTVLSGIQSGAADCTGEACSIGGLTILLAIGKAFLSLTGLILLMAVFSKYILPRPFAWATRSADTLFIWSLTWVFAIVILAEVLQLSVEIGAFLAGIALAQHNYAEDLRRRVHPVMNFFIIVFFVLLGVQMDFSEALNQISASMILSLFVLIGNPFIFIFILARMGYGEKTAFFTGVTVAQISEFSFIFVAAGVSSGAISSSILSVTSLVGIITISISAYMIIYSEELYSFLARYNLLKFFKAANEGVAEKEMIDEHVIIVGMNSLGKEIVSRLKGRGFNVLAIDTDPRKLAGLGCRTMIGNVEYASTLEEAGFHKAGLVVSALQIEDTNNLLAFHCAKAAIPFAVHAPDPSMKEGLLNIGADHIISPKESVILTYQRYLLEEAKL